MKFITLETIKLPPFISVPHFLWDSCYSNLTNEAKLLYGMLLSRTGLSQKNRWTDENGYVFVYFTIEEVMKKLDCGEQKASRLMKSLEKHRLIYRKRHGMGKPYHIFPLLVEITDDNR